MKTPMGDAHSRTRRPIRRVRYALVFVLIAVLALVVSGCVRISGLEYSNNSERGPAYKIVVNVRPNNPDPTGDARGVIAFRHPAGWTVESVTYSGSHSGEATYSPTIANYFETEWDATPDDAGHNGPKGGYVWWAGYGNHVHQFASTDSYAVTIIVDTTGMGGSLTFDVVTGLTDGADPEDDTNKTFWQLGSLEEDGRGARLDVAVYLAALVEPTIVDMDPEDGATNVSPDVIAHVRYSEPVANFAGNVFLTWVGAAGEKVPAIVSYSTSTNTVNVDPLAPLTPDKVYMLVSTADVTDVVGNACEGANAVFTVEPAAVAPTVTAVSPASGATGVDVGANVTATFDQAMDATTISTETFELTKQGAATPVAASVTYSAANMTATLNPESPLEAGTVYTARLTTDVESAAGLALEAAYTWSFTTAEEEPEDAFVDVPLGAPYYSAIQGMAEAEIINGYDNGDGTFSFRPENPVWRWQFAKMIVGALLIPCNEGMTAPFTDLDPDDPTKLDMTEFVRAAYDNGITQGTGGTNFSPYLEISRAQVVTMVVRAVQARFPGMLGVPYSGYTNTWGTAFSADHGANARLAEYNGLLAGLPLTGAASNPWGSMSRGEVAQVLWNVMGMID